MVQKEGQGDEMSGWWTTSQRLTVVVEWMEGGLGVGRCGLVRAVI